MSPEPSEVNAIRHLADVFLNHELWGVPVKTVLEVLLSLYVCFGLAYRGGKTSWKTLGWLFTPRASGVVEAVSEAAAKQATVPLSEYAAEHQPIYSPAMYECLEALSCPEPTYDPAKFVLSCAGMQVQFSSDSPGASVGAVTFGDKQVLPLLTQEERRLACDHAVQLKLQVVQRDEGRANRKLAAEMRQARMEDAARHDAGRLEKRIDLLKSLRARQAGQPEVPEGKTDSAEPDDPSYHLSYREGAVPVSKPRQPPLINGPKRRA